MRTIYPSGQHAESLIKYQVERIRAMEHELATLRQENEILNNIIQKQLNPITHAATTEPVRQD
jgi:hypothetical protein